MLVACLTSLVALNGKNHAGTGNSAAFTVTQPLERAQNDAFGPPILLTETVKRDTGGANNDFGLVLVNSEMSVTGGANNDFGLSC